MRALGCLTLLAFLALLLLLPIVFGDLMMQGLGKLHIGSSAALLLVLAMMLGGLVNIPLRRLEHPDEVAHDPLGVFWLGGVWPQLQRPRRATILAVNVGGCLVPLGIAVYELVQLAQRDVSLLGPTFAAAAIDILVCHRAARMVPRLGITLPGFVAPGVALAAALLLAPDQAPPIAFVAGVLGPLVGADLLHLRDIEQSGPGVMSIGGAGTFDGIVLSGIVAAYLA